MARLGVALGGRKENLRRSERHGGVLIVLYLYVHALPQPPCGILIGQGKDVQTAMRARWGATVEGLYALLSAHQLSPRPGGDGPICSGLTGCSTRTAGQEVVNQLMTGQAPRGGRELDILVRIEGGYRDAEEAANRFQ